MPREHRIAESATAASARSAFGIGAVDRDDREPVAEIEIALNDRANGIAERSGHGQHDDRHLVAQRIVRAAELDAAKRRVLRAPRRRGTAAAISESARRQARRERVISRAMGRSGTSREECLRENRAAARRTPLLRDAASTAPSACCIERIVARRGHNLDAVRIDRSVALNHESDLGDESRVRRAELTEDLARRRSSCTTDMETRGRSCRCSRRRLPSRPSSPPPAVGCGVARLRSRPALGGAVAVAAFGGGGAFGFDRRNASAAASTVLVGAGGVSARRRLRRRLNDARPRAHPAARRGAAPGRSAATAALAPGRSIEQRRDEPAMENDRRDRAAGQSRCRRSRHASESPPAGSPDPRCSLRWRS